MSQSKTLTIKLSDEDSDRLETEARRLNLLPDELAQKILRDRLSQASSSIDPREALLRLREIGRKMPSVDAVQLARESRDALTQRESF